MSVRASRHVRLTDSVRRVLEERGAPGRDAFVRFCKSKGFHIKAYAAYTDLGEGLAVERAAGEAFAQYLVHRGYIEASAAESALAPALPPVVDDGLFSSPSSVLSTLLGPLSDSLEDRNGYYVCDPDSEIPRIAEGIVSFIGRSNPSLDDGLGDVERGQKIMNRTVDEHARWLRDVHARDRRAIMYGVKEQRGRRRIVSVSVMFATTPEACERFCAGEISDLEIRPTDMVSPGRHLHLNALAPIGEWESFGDKEVERCQIRSLYMQAAYFTRTLRPFRPTVYTAAATPAYERRLASHGYLRTGADVKGSDKPIVRLEHPSDRGRRWTSRVHYASYAVLLLSLKLFQAWNRKRWAGPSAQA